MRRKGVKYAKGEPIGCPKCSYPTKETKDLSMSSELVMNLFQVYQSHSVVLHLSSLGDVCVKYLRELFDQV